ncbi:MAG: trans-sulfuration enzyme family protein [Muribaculaceae bacterium]
MKLQTKAIDTPFPKKDAYGSLAMPVYHTCAYEFATAAQMSDAFTGVVLEPDYSRVMNPTVTYFEDKVKSITGAANVFAFSSGMQAITNALLSVAEAGKTIVTSPHLFGNSFSLITKTLARFGVRSKIVDLTNLEAVEAAMDDDSVCLLYLEIITNPQMEVADLKALSRCCKRHGVPLVADTTMIPFTEFRAGDLGVDIEVVSSTKYISGGATSLGGLVIDYGTFPEVNKRIRFELLFNVGGYMTPHAAYMQTLGLETLAARYCVQQKNTLTVAHALRELPQIQRVNYLGFDDNKYHKLAQSQFGSTSGCMLTIDLESEQACYRFIDSLKLVRRATNLFDNKTLAIHPYSTIFGGFTPQEKAAMDVLPTTIRISVGLEDTDDIIEDIKQALI